MLVQHIEREREREKIEGKSKKEFFFRHKLNYYSIKFYFLSISRLTTNIILDFFWSDLTKN